MDSNAHRLRTNPPTSLPPLFRWSCGVGTGFSRDTQQTPGKNSPSCQGRCRPPPHRSAGGRQSQKSESSYSGARSQGQDDCCCCGEDCHCRLPPHRGRLGAGAWPGLNGWACTTSRLWFRLNSKNDSTVCSYNGDDLRETPELSRRPDSLRCGCESAVQPQQYFSPRACPSAYAAR